MVVRGLAFGVTQTWLGIPALAWAANLVSGKWNTNGRTSHLERSERLNEMLLKALGLVLGI